MRRCEQDRACARAIRAQVLRDRSQRQLVRAAGFAGPRAGLGFIPVVEQAKGVVMFRQRCGPEEALELLRLASERGSVGVQVLAAQIVTHAASPPADTNSRPTRAAASRHP